MARKNAPEPRKKPPTPEPYPSPPGQPPGSWAMDSRPLESAQVRPSGSELSTNRNAHLAHGGNGNLANNGEAGFPGNM